MQLASYLEGRPLMWMMPLHLHVNQKSDYDDDILVSLILNFEADLSFSKSRIQELSWKFPNIEIQNIEKSPTINFDSGAEG